MSYTAAHLRSRSLNIVSLSDMIEGSYCSWHLYTTGQLVDGLQQKKKKRKENRFSLKGNGTMSSFLGQQFYRSTLYTRILRAILNKSWRQHLTKKQLYSHLPLISKIFKVRRTRHAGHCWRSRKEIIRDLLLWTPSYGRAKAGRLARTYIQQLCEDAGCSPGDLPEAINDREGWWERVRWWWW